MASPALVDLKSHLEQLVVGDSLSLTPALFGDDIDLSDPLKAVLDKLTIRVQNPQIGFANEAVRVAGTAALFGPYKARAVLEIADINGRLTPHVDLDVLSEMGQPMRLEDILDRLVGSVPRLPGGLSIPRLSLGDFEQVALRAKIAGEITVGLGRSVVFRDLEIEAGSAAGTVRGVAKIGSIAVPFSAVLPDEFTLSGDLPKFDALQLISELTGKPLSGMPKWLSALALPPTRYSIPSWDTTPGFVIDLQDDRLGNLCLVVDGSGDQWESAVAYRAPKDWRFSQLAPVLAPLDAIQIDRPTLTYATASRDVLDCAIGNDVGALPAGFKFQGDLRLEGPLFGVVKTLSGGKETLPLILAAQDGLGSATFVVSVGGLVPLVPGAITLSDTNIELTPNPFALMLSSTAQVELFDKKLPTMIVKAGITETTTKIVAGLKGEWKDPFGIKGLTIEDLIVEMEPTASAYGILGRIRLGQGQTKIITVAGKFLGSAPKYLYGELQGKLTMGDALRMLLPGANFSLPDFLDKAVYIRDCLILMVAEPDTLPDPKHTKLEPGFAFKGYLGFFGLELDTKVVVNPEQGFSVDASLDKPIEIGGGILRIFWQDKDGKDLNRGPQIEVDSAKSLFSLSGGANLLGFELSAIANFSKDGLKFKQDIKLGPLSFDVEFKGLSPWDFEAAVSFRFTPGLRIGPIKEPNTGITLLPAFTLDVELAVTVAIEMRPDHFSQSVAVDFHFWGVDFKLRFDLDTRDLRDPAQVIKDHIIKNSYDIFMQLFKGADDPLTFVMGLWDGLSGLGDDLVKVWKDLGDDAALIWKAMIFVDPLALPAIGSLSLVGWKTMQSQDWIEAASWEPPVWMDVASWKDEVWNAIASGQVDRQILKKLSGADQAKDDFLKDNGLGELVKAGTMLKKGAIGAGHAGGDALEDAGNLVVTIFTNPGKIFGF
jgi:hypothetical protein